MSVSTGERESRAWLDLQARLTVFLVHGIHVLNSEGSMVATRLRKVLQFCSNNTLMAATLSITGCVAQFFRKWQFW